MHDSVTQSDLDRLKHDLDYEASHLRDRIDSLERQLETERDARREAVREVWDRLSEN